MSKSPQAVLEDAGTQIIKYDAMCKAIRACHSVDEVTSIRDKARALEVYAAQALNTDAERKACEIRLRAERRAGELLRAMKQKGERATAEKGRPTKASSDTRLSDLGISADQSSKWQALAEVPEEEFESAMRNPEIKPSTAGIIAKAKDAPKMNPAALWVWGRLRDFERDRIAEQDPDVLFDEMTTTMQDDVHRIAPMVSAWISKLGGS